MLKYLLYLGRKFFLPPLGPRRCPVLSAIVSRLSPTLDLLQIYDCQDSASALESDDNLFSLNNCFGIITNSVGRQFRNLGPVNSLHGRHSNVQHVQLYNIFSTILWRLLFTLVFAKHPGQVSTREYTTLHNFQIRRGKFYVSGQQRVYLIPGQSDRISEKFSTA
jgi:hypothetical protein